MNTRKFFSRDDVALIRQNIKAGAMTVDDIHLIVKNELNAQKTTQENDYGCEIKKDVCYCVYALA